jgi:hypothetical protein
VLARVAAPRSALLPLWITLARKHFGTLTQVGLPKIRSPRTIVKSRYGGAYEGGLWIALPCYPDTIPSAVNDDDNDCQWWFENPTLAVGVGANPTEALDRLEAVVDSCTHPEEYRRGQESKVSVIWCSFCDEVIDSE